MSAEVLRRAAALMRERAESARAGRWMSNGVEVVADWHSEPRNVALAYGSDVPEGNLVNAAHIASWHPAVALAVAKAIDDVALAWEIADENDNGYVYDAEDDHWRFEETVDGGWLAVAHAYLGVTP